MGLAPIVTTSGGVDLATFRLFATTVYTLGMVDDMHA